MSNVLCICGSTQKTGGTVRALRKVLDIYPDNVETVFLHDYNFSYYDYENRNRDDDFLPLAQKMTQVETIIFVTPVYWYAMSAIMKTFLDRLTDLITIEKSTGRALAGKKCFVICSGYGVDIPPGFDYPFAATCNYFDMTYKGCLYESVKCAQEQPEYNINEARIFAEKIFGKK